MEPRDGKNRKLILVAPSIFSRALIVRRKDSLRVQVVRRVAQLRLQFNRQGCVGVCHVHCRIVHVAAIAA